MGKVYTQCTARYFHCDRRQRRWVGLDHTGHIRERTQLSYISDYARSRDLRLAMRLQVRIYHPLANRREPNPAIGWALSVNVESNCTQFNLHHAQDKRS